MTTENVNTFDKGGRTLVMVHKGLSGPGRILRMCDCPECVNLPRHERYRIAPCGCHGLIVICTCRLRDVMCKRCGRIFVRAGGDFYEVEDPHAKRGKTP